MKGYTKLRGHETPAVKTLLDAHCTKGANGLAVYEAGWDDARVAEVLSEQIGRKITSSSIEGLRRAWIGHLPGFYPPKKKPAIDDAWKTAIEERMATMEASMRNVLALLDENKGERAELMKRMAAFEVRLAGLYRPQPTLDLLAPTIT